MKHALQAAPPFTGKECFHAFPLEPLALANPEYSRRSEASLVTLRDGLVLAAYTNHAGPGDAALAGRAPSGARAEGGSAIERDNHSGEIVAVVLDAAGRVISPERQVVEAPTDGLNVMSPALRRLPDGRLGMLYSHRESTRCASRRFIVSADEGATWTSPVIVADGAYKTGCHDRFTVLASGRLLAPCHCADDWDEHHLHVRVSRSDDLGVTWTLGAPVMLPRVRWPDGGQPQVAESGAMEPGIAERSDGSLLMTVRTAMGTQFGTASVDGGVTWSAARSLEVASPLAPAHLSRIPGTDELLLIWTPNFDAMQPMLGHRHTLLACVSADGGVSWPLARRKLLVHDVTRNTDYPAVLYRGDEVWIAVRVSDHAEVIQGRMSTRLMRVPLEWLRGS